MPNYKKYFNIKKKDIITDRIIQAVQADGKTWFSNGFIAIDEYYFKSHKYYPEWALLVQEKFENDKLMRPEIDRLIPDLKNYQEVTPSYVVDFTGEPVTTFEDQNLWSVTVNPAYIAFFEDCMVYKASGRRKVPRAYKYMALDRESPVAVVVDDKVVGLIMPLRN